jgi:hypothetical protein
MKPHIKENTSVKYPLPREIYERKGKGSGSLGRSFPTIHPIIWFGSTESKGIDLNKAIVQGLWAA